jgi:hypothetical protein
MAVVRYAKELLMAMAGPMALSAVGAFGVVAASNNSRPRGKCRAGYTNVSNSSARVPRMAHGFFGY